MGLMCGPPLPQFVQLKIEDARLLSNVLFFFEAHHRFTYIHICICMYILPLACTTRDLNVLFVNLSEL